MTSKRQSLLFSFAICFVVSAESGPLFLQVRDTRQNAESSRSHQIVRIFVESRPSLPAMPEGNPFH